MSHTLEDIAQQLRDNPKKVQLIYAFNGTGKTRLSRAFKELVAPKSEDVEDETQARDKILYYNAFTEDLFYWDNDLDEDQTPKLKIQPNSFTPWILEVEGQDTNIVNDFRGFGNDKITPIFNQEYQVEDRGQMVTIPAQSEVTFTLTRGDDQAQEVIKISKGEESSFIWSIFFSLVDAAIEQLNIPEPEERTTPQFNDLQYIFIDDPVSSLDESNVISTAVRLATLIRNSHFADGVGVRFIITTHNPLFFNVLWNEHRSAYSARLERNLDGAYNLTKQETDSPFSYHLSLLKELKHIYETGQVKKYHFNLLRNILEKTSTFLGISDWKQLLPQSTDGLPNPYEKRIIDFSSHSKHAAEEVNDLSPQEKETLGFLVNDLIERYQFKIEQP